MQSSLNTDNVGLLIAMARRRMKQVVASRLVRHGLGPQQFWVLLNLHEDEGLSLHELAQRTWTDDPTACRIISKLTERGLVRGQEDPADRRRFRLSLTTKGRKLAGELAELASDVRLNLVRGLSGSERKQLCDLLRKVIVNTDRLEEAAEAPARKLRKAS